MEALRAPIPQSTTDALRDTFRSRTGTLALTFAVLFVAAVSIYDGYLVIRTGDLIVEFEKNPVGLFLIQYNHSDPSLFLRLKAAGTVVVLSAVVGLHRQSPRIAIPVCGALVVFQAGLMFCLQM
jgi:hypothetical protein